MRTAIPFTALALLLSAPAPAAPPTSPGIVLVVHGGAGNWSADGAERIEAARAALTKAAEAGHAILAKGGASLDAVEATLAVLEDSGAFDAGRGAYYTRDGVPELDAALMDGKTLAAGSVAAVKRLANPIHVARMVMEKTQHVLLVGDGAERFAESQGVVLVSPYHFFNDREWKRWLKRDEEERRKMQAPRAEERHGTVGAVALDAAGNLAAGTSTGGTVWKMPGRVGDSPIIGAGTYASNDGCAVSGTGVGEFFIRDVVASDISARVKYAKEPLKKAADDVVMKELVAQKAEGGVIALDRQGNVATPFNTNGMIRAVVRADGKVDVKVFADR
jgi:beta-aspartyl-peptidase (threonine type)